MIYRKAFAHEVNENKRDINMLKTASRIDRLHNRPLTLTLSVPLRSTRRMTIIRKVPDDIQQESQSMEVNRLTMLVSRIAPIMNSSHCLVLLFACSDSQNGMPWLAPSSSYLPNDLASAHGTYTDPNGTCLPSMATFRSQQQAAYAANSNEQTVQTGETLGKALQSVGYPTSTRQANHRSALF